MLVTVPPPSWALHFFPESSPTPAQHGSPWLGVVPHFTRSNRCLFRGRKAGMSCGDSSCVPSPCLVGTDLSGHSPPIIQCLTSPPGRHPAPLIHPQGTTDTHFHRQFHLPLRTVFLRELKWLRKGEGWFQGGHDFLRGGCRGNPPHCDGETSQVWSHLTPPPWLTRSPLPSDLLAIFSSTHGLIPDTEGHVGWAVDLAQSERERIFLHVGPEIPPSTQGRTGSEP